jgi:hypothetical protein
MIEKHFVTFYSPGTFVSEMTVEPVDSWDVEEATSKARHIIERYGARPYGFRFTTRRNDGELDSKEVRRSGMYFLGGEVLTLQQVKDRNDPADRILISNMECNGYEKVVENRNSWKATIPLNEGDTVLEFASSV